LVILWRYLKFSIGSFRACIRNKNKFGDRYFVLPYEQLVQNPVDIMTSVCELCGIEFADIILKPTELGNPYGGNNKEGRIFRGISNHGVGAWRSRMPDEFAMIMEHGREEEMTQLGYEPHFSVNQTRPIFEQFLDEIRAIKKRRLLGRYDERLFDDQSAAVGVSSVD
jgi:hypothetical protein